MQSNNIEMMELDIIDDIICSASDKSNIQKILLCCDTKSLQKASYLLAYEWKNIHTKCLGLGFYDVAWWHFHCFHYHSLMSNCPDVLRKSEDEWKTYHLTQFPLAFWYSTLCPKNITPATYCRDNVTYCRGNKQSLSSTDPMCCDKRTFVFWRHSELHQSENLMRRDTCKSSEMCDLPCLNSGSGT